MAEGRAKWDPCGECAAPQFEIDRVRGGDPCAVERSGQRTIAHLAPGKSASVGIRNGERRGKRKRQRLSKRHRSRMSHPRIPYRRCPQGCAPVRGRCIAAFGSDARRCAAVCGNGTRVSAICGTAKGVCGGWGVPDYAYLWRVFRCKSDCLALRCQIWLWFLSMSDRLRQRNEDFDSLRHSNTTALREGTSVRGCATAPEPRAHRHPPRNALQRSRRTRRRRARRRAACRATR